MTRAKAKEEPAVYTKKQMEEIVSAARSGTKFTTAVWMLVIFVFAIFVVPACCALSMLIITSLAQ